MTLTNVKLGHNRRLYASRAQEGTYGAGGTTLDIVFNCRAGEGEYLQRQPITTLDSETATGYEASTQQFHMGHDVPPITVPLLASAEAIGFGLGYMLGSDTKSGTTNITHAFLPIALTSGFPGSTEFEDHQKGALQGPNDVRAKGVYVTELVLSGGRTGHINFDMTIRGNGAVGSSGDRDESTMAKPNRASGIFAAQSATIGLKAVSTEHDPEALVFATPDAAWTAKNITTGNSWVPFTDELQTWRIAIRNIFEEDTTRSSGQGSSSGLVGSCPVVERREVEVTLTFLDEPNTFDDYLSVLNSATDSNNVERSIGIELVNDYDLNSSDFATVLIHVPIARLLQNAKGAYGSKNELSMTFFAGQSLGADAYPIVRAWTCDNYNGVYNQA